MQELNMVLTPMKTLGELTIYSRPKNRPRGTPRYVVFRGVLQLEEFTRYSKAHGWCKKQKEGSKDVPLTVAPLLIDISVENMMRLAPEVPKLEFIKWLTANRASMVKQIEELGLVVVYNQLRQSGHPAELSVPGATMGIFDASANGPVIQLPSYRVVPKMDLSVEPPPARAKPRSK